MQLTVGALLQFIKELKASGMSLQEIADLPIYLGRDDELNGIHTGWYTNLIDPDDTNCADFVELIGEDRCNVPLKGKAVLIS